LPERVSSGPAPGSSLGPSVDPELRCPSRLPLLAEDADLVAIDKPAFVPCQEARDGAGDDAVARLGRMLALRDGAAPSLGVHQRLDAATSGVVVYAKTAAGNAELARAFEAREVAKRYVAVVESRDRIPEGLLVDRLLHERGLTRVDSRGDEAVARVRLLERRGARALVEVQLETGRTHQIRVQLASRGAPIVGDVRYGGAFAERLMLHAEALGLPGRAPILAPRPAAFEDALARRERDPLRDLELLRARLLTARERRHGLGHAAARGTTAFRLLHAEADGVPGLALDVYGDFLVAHLFRDDVDEPAVLDAVHETLGFRGLYLKRRPVQANELGEAGTRERAPSTPVRGEAAPNEGVVHEHGVPYLVRLGDGLSTGLFLDQREARRKVAALFEARPGRLLNLFSYTCGFSVAAALAGAETVNVDASKAALDRGSAGIACIGGDPQKHRFLHDDALDVLPRLARRGERFDAIVCDPPTYAKTKKHRWTSSKKEWTALFAQCLAVLAPGGTLYASSNDQRLPHAAFRAAARAGADEAGVPLDALRDAAAQEDFPAGAEGPSLRALVALRG
jgi:23S rRNA (cytosine1962-C5)-methyltransferase